MIMINNKLKQLYFEKFSAENPCVLKQLREKRQSLEKPAYPLLIKVNEETLAKADITIMTFGQETNSWEQKVSDSIIPLEKSKDYVEKTVDVFMDYYKKLMNEKTNDKDKRSPFWDFHYQLKNKKFPAKSVEIIWNNIYKIGNKHKKKNKPSSSIREFENKYFDTIEHEINIIKPNLIIFVTGPNYEKRLEKKFKINEKYDLGFNIPIRELARLDLSIGIPAYRTYHPTALRLQKKMHYIDIIIANYLQRYS